MLKNLKKIAWGRVILVLAVLVLLGGGVYGTYFFYNKYQELKKNPTMATQLETDRLKADVGKLMDLPADEEPTIATVLDKEKLKDQDFFKTAENGDKLLAYIKAKEAILYRPSTNKIVKVAPIYINANDTSSTGGTTTDTSLANTNSSTKTDD